MRSSARLGDAIARMRLLLGLGRDGEALPPGIVAAQAKAARIGYPATFAFTILASVALLFAYRSAARVVLILPPFTLLMAVSAYSLVRWRRDARAGWAVADARRRVIELARLSSATALAWHVLLSAALLLGDAADNQLIMCMSLGVTALGALGAAPLPFAGVAFLGTSLLLIPLQLRLDEAPPAMYIMLIVFVLMLARSVVTQAGTFVDNFLAHRELVESAQQHEQLAIDAQRERERATLAEARARADRRERIASERQSDLVSLADKFDRSVGDAMAGLTATATSNKGSVGELALVVTQSSRQVTSISGRAATTNEAAAILRETADGLRRSVAAISGQVARQTELTATAEDSAGRGEAAFAALVEHADKIGDIVAAIAKVAGQTNLLALNATIEAARAGDAGRGFSIVAQEVKALAAQTKRAADDIGRQIDDMQAVVRSAAVANGDVFETIRSVTGIAREIDLAMIDQARVVTAMGAAAATAAQSTTGLREDVEAAARAAGECAALTTTVTSATEALVGEVDTIARSAELFLADLRAA